MKQEHLIFMNMTTPGACVFASRSEWSLEITREPRPSCIAKWSVRNSLRELAPGERETIGGVDVYRRKTSHNAARYMIDEQWYKFDEAVAAIEAGKECAA